MKVLTISATMDPIHGGGNAERTLQLCKALTQNDISTSLLTLDKGLTSDYKQKLKPFNLTAIPCLNKRFDFFIFGFKKIKMLVSEADVIHMIGHWSWLNAIAHFYIRKYDKPYFFCPAGAYFPRGRSTFIKKLYNSVVGKKIMGHAYNIIAVTEDEARQLSNVYPEKKVIVIPNGVNESNYIINKNSDIRTSKVQPPYLLFIGRLNEIKGPDLLLKAFVKIAHEHPDYTLVFAGPDDGMLSTLKQQTKEYELIQRVIFTGHVAGESKTQLLTDASCLVIPSRSEAMSIVILEAGICATPAIFTDQCGLANFAYTGGALQVSVDSEILYQTLQAFISLSETEKKEMGKILYNFVQSHYTWSNIAKKYIRAFSCAVDKKLSNSGV